MASKVMVLGAVNGNLKPTFAKLAKLQSKTPFAFAIAVGDLFADQSQTSSELEEQVESLLSGDLSVPLPLYFTLGRHSLPAKIVKKLKENNDEVCTNLIYLGKRSTFKTAEGIRIVTLGGILDPSILSAITNDEDKYLPFHTENDTNVLRGAHSTDILITSVWPSGITNGSKIAIESELLPSSDQSIATLCAALKPRYHFSSSPDVFFEREPFYFPPPENDPDARPFTRFISLGSSTSATKAKALYAFNIQASSAPPSAIPAGSTPSPFGSTPSSKRSAASQENSYSRFASNGRSGGHHENHANKRRRRDGDRKMTTQAECFFCLSNPNLSTHLIAAIGDDSYLTTSRGPVPTSSTFAPALKCPAHILIIPLPHSPTVAAIESSDGEGTERKTTYAEMSRYRLALNAMLLAHGHGEYGSVCWEVSKRDGIHVHWQWMPAAVTIIRDGLVEAGFKVEAENLKYSAVEKRDIGDGSGVGGDWFRVWLWQPRSKEVQGPDGMETDASVETRGTETSLFLPFDRSHRFDLQFGRRVMAKLLGTPQRAHWKDCPQTVDEEKADVAAFKEAFKAWDFSQ